MRDADPSQPELEDPPAATTTPLPSPRRRSRRADPVSTKENRRPFSIRGGLPTPVPIEAGPRVARAYQGLVAALCLVAWLSLAVQVHALMGRRGLMPFVELLDAAARQGGDFADLPTFLWWTRSDGALTFGVAAGIGLSALALLGVATRACLVLQALAYLSFVAAGRTFFSFQWDNLLLESSMLAALLPRRPGRDGGWMHLLLRLLCFKLYFESGLAKAQSPLGDWLDGSAMTFYFETAPLPTRLAHFAHSLPDGWHHLESWLVLALELAVPFAFFAPRRARLAACAALTLFQLLDLATANYGFFCYLSLALHVVLLDDADVRRAVRRITRWRSGRAVVAALVLARRRRGRLARALAQRATRSLSGLAAAIARGSSIGSWRRRGRHAATAAVVLAWSSVSLAGALLNFTQTHWLAPADLGPLGSLASPLRLVNTYHLFAAMTRERIEPELQIGATMDGELEAYELWHKPGDPTRAPDFVAPHQPRLDFQLWFYGLSFRRGMPPYVGNLLDRLCRDPAAVQGFFRRALPARPARVRLVFWRYTFTSPSERAATGAYWHREMVLAPPATTCLPAP